MADEKGGRRRFTRFTNGFSKKLENHRAAVSLYVSHYNLCCVHEALRITPAMYLGVTDHIWDIGELIEAATMGDAPEPEGRYVGGFRVIDGGKAWQAFGTQRAIGSSFFTKSAGVNLGSWSEH